MRLIAPSAVMRVQAKPGQVRLITPPAVPLRVQTKVFTVPTTVSIQSAKIYISVPGGVTNDTSISNCTNSLLQPTPKYLLTASPCFPLFTTDR